jgi:hypothetical protein
MLLNKASASDELTTMVVAELFKYCPALSYLHFFKEPGNGTTEPYGADVDGTFENRALGSAFGSATLAPAYGTFTLKIIGKTIQLDVAYEDRYFGNVAAAAAGIASEFSRQLKSWAENAGRNLMYKILNDTSATANQFNGIRKIIADQVTAGDSTRVISSGTNGHQIVLGSDNAATLSQQKFIEYLDQLIDSVDGGADYILMDNALLTRLSSVAKGLCTVSLNDWGAKVGDYNGTPIVPTSRNYDGTRIIPFTETVGTSTDCTSVFAVRSREKAGLTCMTTNSGLFVYPMKQVGNFYQVMPQLQMDMAALSKRCVAQLKGIRI